MRQLKKVDPRIVAAVITGIAAILAAIWGKDAIEVIVSPEGDSDIRATSSAVIQLLTQSISTQLALETTSASDRGQSETATMVEVTATYFSTGSTVTPTGIIVTNTGAPEISTDTPTSTPLPAPSDTPAPQIAFPFIDNFDEQKNSLWEELSGTWLIEGGRYTGLAGTGVGWFWTKLNITELSDLRLSVNVKIPSYGAANEGDFAIAVRGSQTKEEYIGYVFGFPRSTASWSFIEENDRSAITNAFEKVPAEANFVIEVVGDRFVAKVNGFEKQSITLSGYDRTWIGLGLKCGYKCPSFDDLRLEPIP